ncbi:hypothetical protein [Micrococcus sp.]|uniref:hypothetical protein n=1 Tax=Micrococcus sp. TaxID=1271 RepID=UPI0026DD895B|nr:hypothetical protein [Micrococcus sp.]MDO4239238.1 hypothetical protein [Micrococcus sp.]
MDKPRIDEELRGRRTELYKSMDRVVAGVSLPPLAKRFVGRKPSKALLKGGGETWHQSVVYALCGETVPLVVLMRSQTYFVASAYPHRTAYMEQTAHLLEWCALRTGLLGWAEVWNVPSTLVERPGAGAVPPLVWQGDYRYVRPETDAVFRRDFGDLSGKSGWRSVPNGEVSGLQQLVMALERTVLALSVPALNNVGLPEERLLELVDFYARMIRMWMGLPQEQPVAEPDFSVDLPAEFQGFGPEVWK